MIHKVVSPNNLFYTLQIARSLWRMFLLVLFGRAMTFCELHMKCLNPILLSKLVEVSIVFDPGISVYLQIIKPSYPKLNFNAILGSPLSSRLGVFPFPPSLPALMPPSLIIFSINVLCSVAKFWTTPRNNA